MNRHTLPRPALRLLVAFAFIWATFAAQAQTMVRVQTTQGAIDMALLDSQAPLTVANFLAYVRGGDYTDVFFHRNAWLSATTPFVIQAGGYQWTAAGGIGSVASRGTIANEFSATRSNVRGTVAMAKVQHNPPQAGDPDTATSQWFINMGNNAANLDTQNGGFTVFARVTVPGMATADRIAALPNVNAGSPFDSLPVQNWQAGTQVARSNVVLFTDVRILPSQSASDRIFNYLEAAYPQYLAPSNGAPGEAQGYVFRYYGASNAYVGTKDNQVWYLVPAISPEVRLLGTMADWLNAASGAGY
jgi:peptidyl-prolyl cis-trans isomerase A (cyclophilin A)